MRNLGFFKYLSYSMLVILLYILQATPDLMPELFGSKPLLLLPLALAISSVEKEVPSLVFGAVCGGLTDLASGGGIGYFAIILTLICYFESHVFSTYFVPNIFSATVHSAIATVLSIGVYFLIFKVFSGIPDWHILFVNHYISRIVYTFVMFIPICILVRFLHKSF
ncbi:MAG: rod shape-determining protein MreD [Ruminococcus sp.]